MLKCTACVLVPSGTYWALVKLEACGVEQERLFYLQVL